MYGVSEGILELGSFQSEHNTRRFRKSPQSDHRQDHIPNVDFDTLKLE